MNERREFLKKIAKGTAYAAPVIYTLSTPRHLMAIVTSGMMLFNTQQGLDANTDQPGPTAPWSNPPPGSTPPGSTPPGGTSGTTKPPGGTSDG